MFTLIDIGWISTEYSVEVINQIGGIETKLLSTEKANQAANITISFEYS